ncbi:MAG TPA: hypothetical protein VFJ19_19880 [Nocardioidaceae bacterium]|nr:hypothetical protein [Nocardioidaceae bacterium]
MIWLWVLVAVLVAVLVGAWLTWTASRLDRMHHRVDVARVSLDTQLVHRSGTSLELAASGVLDPASALLVHDAAHQARAVAPEELESAESDLSQVLRAVLDEPDEVDRLRRDPDMAALLDELAGNCRRVELARRFHNDMVATVRGLRSRRRVRWLGLAGHATEPATVEFDDAPPPTLL